MKNRYAVFLAACLAFVVSACASTKDAESAASGITVNEAIKLSVKDVAAAMPNARVIIAGFDAEPPDNAAVIIDELRESLSGEGLEVVERDLPEDLQAAPGFRYFTMTDEDLSALGRSVGAQAAIVGEWGSREFRLSALDVEKAVRVSDSQFGVGKGLIANRLAAARREPKYAGDFLVQGALLLDMGKYDDALEYLNTAINMAPEFILVYLYRGNTYGGKHDYDSAIADFSRVIELYPNETNANYNRGNVYTIKGDYDSAIADYTRVIAQNPKDGEAYRYRGAAYFNKKSYAQAIADCTQAVKLNPKDAIAYNTRGKAYQDTGEPEKAFDDYTKAVEINPNFAEPYYNRGVLYLSKSQISLAKQDVEKAVQLSPNFQAAKDLLKTLQQAGRK